MKKVAILLLASIAIFVCSVVGQPSKSRLGTSTFDRQYPSANRAPQSSKSNDKASKDILDKMAAAKALNSATVAPNAQILTIEDYVPFETCVLKRFSNFYTGGIQEKLYIHHDKPYYCAGDTLWFKGYVVNAITGVHVDFSKYIYVEFRNVAEGLVTRVKIKADSMGRFANCIALPSGLAQGDYTLCGYTRWMSNSESEFFFAKKIRVVNPIDDSFNISVSYIKDNLGNLTAEATLKNSFGELIANEKVSSRVTIDGKSKGTMLRSDDNGRVSIPIVSPSETKSVNTIELSVDSPTVKGRKSVFMPILGNDFDIQFFPEGGDLVSTQTQNVAFKAVGANGMGVDVELKLYENNGQEVWSCTSTHLGMGRFTLVSQANNPLYVMATVDGLTKRFDLPKPLESGCALQLHEVKGKLMYQSSFTADLDPTKFAVVLHSKGKLIWIEQLSSSKLIRVMPKSALPSGICHLTVVDIATLTPVAQRIFFVKDESPAKVSLTANRPSYGSRELVSLNIDVTDAKGVPLSGDYSISVTDRGTVRSDSTDINILSYMMLCSDIKGYIEKPSYYFSANSLDVSANLDLLMMTQGWRRFDVGALLKGDLPKPKYAHEESQSISGDVKGFFGGDAKRPKIVIFEPKGGYMEVVELNTSSRFNLVGLDFQDSTKFIIQAMSKGGNNRFVTLNIKETPFPDFHSVVPKPMVGAIKESVPQSFLDQSKQRFYYQGGMKVVDIEAVSVTTSRSEQPTHIFNINPTRTIGSDVIEKYAGSDIYSILRMFPGVVVNGTTISIRNSQDPPLLYLDDMHVDVEFLDNIVMSDVKTIDLVSGPEAAIFGLGASGGVIIITLKDGSEVSKSAPTLPSMQNVMQLGYKKPTHFYQPKYEVAQVRSDTKPDLRSTIYWNPTLTTNTQGKGCVQFYTADTPTTYDIVIEGLSKDGHIIRSATTIKR